MNLKRDEKDFFDWLYEKGINKDTFIRYSRYGGYDSRPAYDVRNRGGDVFDLAIKGAKMRNETAIVELLENNKRMFNLERENGKEG